MKRLLSFLVIIAALACVLQPNVSCAADFANSEEVYGSTPSGDMSRIFLGQIFGTINHSGLTGSGSLMPAVFKAFNTVSLGIGSVIIMFTLIVSTLNTAHQGEILGQQWSTVWIPLRAILGVGVLIPTAAGYTLLQSFIMWAIMQGVGAANYMWQEAVSAVGPDSSHGQQALAPGSVSGHSSSEMTERGWIMAGAYYYDLTKSLAGDDVLGQVTEKVNFNFAGLGTSDETGDKGADSAIQTGLSEITGSLNIAVASWMHLFTMREGDPLLSIQKTGEQIVATVEMLWIGIAIIAAAIGIAAVCASVSPVFNVLQNFITWLVPLFTSLLTFLFLSGALLAYYVPLIPFILFSLGAIGWMFGVIEAITAAPLIALGIMNPHGNDPYFGRAEPSILLLLDLIIRPSMMIVGMMAAMVMVRITIPFINYGFSITGQNVYSGGISFLTSIIAMIAVYCAIIVTVVQKCFTLIYYVPDRVLRWIGGSPNAFESGASDEREIRGGFEKGMQPFGELGSQAATSKGSMKMATTGFGAQNMKESDGAAETTKGEADGGSKSPGGTKESATQAANKAQEANQGYPPSKHNSGGQSSGGPPGNGNNNKNGPPNKDSDNEGGSNSDGSPPGDGGGGEGGGGSKTPKKRNQRPGSGSGDGTGGGDNERGNEGSSHLDGPPPPPPPPPRSGQSGGGAGGSPGSGLGSATPSGNQGGGGGSQSGETAAQPGKRLKRLSDSNKQKVQGYPPTATMLPMDVTPSSKDKDTE